MVNSWSGRPSKGREKSMEKLQNKNYQLNKIERKQTNEMIKKEGNEQRKALSGQ